MTYLKYSYVVSWKDLKSVTQSKYSKAEYTDPATRGQRRWEIEGEFFIMGQKKSKLFFLSIHKRAEIWERDYLPSIPLFLRIKQGIFLEIYRN